MKPYANYKDSGVPWIGEIPEEWELDTIQRCFKERRSKVSDTDYEPLSVTKSGIVPQLESAAKSDAHDDRKLVLKNDFVINSRSDRKQSCGLSSYDGSVSLINIVLENTRYYPEYSKYLLKNYNFAEEFYRWGSGIVADLWSTNFSRMKKITVPVPPLSTQQKITTYLDKQTTTIDTLISDKEKLLVLLTEKRQAIISEAVTKGLDPHAEMKDSGVEWIGEIPVGWEVKKLKYLGEAIIGLTYSPNDIVDESNEATLVLRSSNIQQGQMAFHDNVYVSSEVPKKLKIKAGDILICSRNGSRNLIGKNTLIKNPEENWSFGAFMTVFRSEYSSFLHYVFNSEIFLFLSGSFLTSTVNQLTTSNLNSMTIPLPPLEVQEQIVQYLDEKTSKIDQITADTKEQIKLLKEYRQSLISEVVTGKVEV